MSAPVYTNIVSFTGQYDGATRPTVTWNAAGGPASGGSVAKIKSVKVTVEKMAEIDDQTEENGATIGFTKKPKGPKKKVTIEAIVQADTAANAAAALVEPPDLSEIVLANFIKPAQALVNGAYVYKTGCKFDLGEDDSAKISLEMYQYATAAATLVAATT